MTTAAEWVHLRDAVVALYLASLADAAVATVLRDVAARAEACAGPDPSRARGARKPVAGTLAALPGMAHTSPTATVLQAFLAVEPAADWMQNANYTPSTIGQDFLNGYGYVEFLGPGRVFECADLRIGFLMLAPHQIYPEHAHPAEEVYHVVAGSADWWRNDDPTSWRAQRPGAIIHHRPHVRHATRTGAEPLLALYCWRGAIGPAAALNATAQ